MDLIIHMETISKFSSLQFAIDALNLLAALTQWFMSSTTNKKYPR